MVEFPDGDEWFRFSRLPELVNVAQTPQFPEEPPSNTITESEPPLEIACGPLLRFLASLDGPEQNLWRGSVLLVTADSGSQYDPYPVLSFKQGPARPSNSPSQPATGSVSPLKLYTESGYTFWRFDLELPMSETEQQVVYCINGDLEPRHHFFIPSIAQSMNVMCHSCNGFSLAVDTRQFQGSLWQDVLREHSSVPLHVMLGGGDQIYADALKLQVPRFKQWTKMDFHMARRKSVPFDAEFESQVRDFYLHHYLKWFGKGFWRGANGSTLSPLFPVAAACIPAVNIWDDHDIIDGFGSYAPRLMETPVFRGIGKAAFRYYLLFQHHSVLDSSDPSWILGPQPGEYVGEKSRSVYARLGRQMAVLGLDCRTERSRSRVVTRETYDVVLTRLRAELKAAPEIRHLLLMLGVPLAYPRLVWLERLLSSRLLYPLKVLAQRGVLLGSTVNEFDGSVEILDDLEDHWCARHHKKERNWLVAQLQQLATETGVRITIVSGDVHLCAVGRFYSCQAAPEFNPRNDARLMFNVVTSAITNTPPADQLAKVLQRRSGVHHFNPQTDEDVLRMFPLNPDGSRRKTDGFLNKRNWCSIMAIGDIERYTEAGDRSGDPEQKNGASVDPEKFHVAGPLFAPAGSEESDVSSVESPHDESNPHYHHSHPLKHLTAHLDSLRRHVKSLRDGSEATSGKPADYAFKGFPYHPDSLSVILHVEKDPGNRMAETAAYEVVIPDLAVKNSQ